MKKIVFVVAPKVFRDEEYIEPKNMLEKAGIKVVTASTVVGDIYGKIKIKARSEMLVTDISVNDYDAIFFVGGGGSSIYFNDKFIHELARDFYKSDKVVSAICSGSVILANSGILKGKRATVFPGDAQVLIEGGANYTAKDVEIDGNIITGNGPLAAKVFAEQLIKALK
ncbi:MAG: DJ-1/PfpI family protein [Endomicrobiaceae bacterium]|nr:DJ-1/PfpI family protein [Endomicrobiaceae bacterium]